MKMSSTSRRLLLFSNSSMAGEEYLQFASSLINQFKDGWGMSKALFIPYALRTHEDYTEKVKKAFHPFGIEIEGIHKAEDPVAAVRSAKAIFVGGGNTFQLLKGLYDHKLIDPIRKSVLQEGVPYVGWSAGSNVATASICTTNDMPIVHPPSFHALALVPFNINPHFVDADPNSTHMGETREQRIEQYHEIEGMPPVLALREGSFLEVHDDSAFLRGRSGAKLFRTGKPVEAFEPEANLSFLLESS
ncbi:unnamed protein product [Darwinula stevensoni]|uniref:dipeptidase E n=1 Tax=Darwinula stevensoni TaxID=69355 RepID=A0A7R9A1G8_9CRUS|nr:unnamed protein product [Darwinula stevensoni]CAG0886611.1 unnamed protein product [Darwinula stevensoni]